LNFNPSGLSNTTFQDNTYLATDSNSFKNAVEQDLNNLVSRYGYGTDWTYVWVTTDWSAGYMNRPVVIEIPNTGSQNPSYAFQSYVLQTYQWNDQYIMPSGGTWGSLTGSSLSVGTDIKYLCADGTLGTIDTCGDTCDNSKIMAFEVMKFIKTLSKQTFTRTYSATSSIGYCQIYIVVDGTVASNWATTHGLVYTTGQSTLPELVAFYDPSAAGQLQADGTYTGGALPDYDPTGGFGASSTGDWGFNAALHHQPMSVLFAIVSLLLALIL